MVSAYTACAVGHNLNEHSYVKHECLDQGTPGLMAYACGQAIAHPDLPREPGAICPEKSVGPDGSVPVKYVNYPRAPSSRRSGARWTPYYPTDSQLQVYDIYIIKRVLLAAHARGREHLDLDLA